MRNKILIFLICIALVAGTISSVYAKDSYMNTFNTTYGTSSTVLNTCALCHPSGTSTHNAYSTAFRNAGRNYRTIENSDSDGDGYTNIAEISARTFPGNSASRPATGDATLPTVTNFVIPSTSTSLTVAITTFTATDNVGVTGYLVNESSTKPSASAAGWSGSAPTSYICSSSGAKTLYAWAKDAAGNVSASRNDSVTITSQPASQGAKIFTAGKIGKYYSDPAAWVSAGYRVNIWGSDVVLKAQAVDANGRKIAGTYSYRISSTGQYGVLDMVDAQNLAYQKTVSLTLGKNYAYTVTVNGTTANGSLYSVPAKCDSCHRKPEGHIADRSTWGDCRGCHNLSNVTHKHLYKYGATFQCYSCHSSDSTSADIHAIVTNASGYTGLTCTTCHGDLTATQNNTFKTAAMAGLPSCTSCHDANHSPPAGSSFSNSVGHGGMLCMSCHGPSHRIQKPANLGISGANNCSSCHTRVSHGSLSCGECHVSSWDPHLVPGASPTSPSPSPPDDDNDDDDDDEEEEEDDD